MRVSDLEAHRHNYKEACRRYAKALDAAKRKHHHEELKDCNSRELFQKVQRMFKPNSSPALPKEAPGISLPERFMNFFVDKINNITDKLTPPHPPPPLAIVYVCIES